MRLYTTKVILIRSDRRVLVQLAATRTHVGCTRKQDSNVKIPAQSYQQEKSHPRLACPS
jgi:hypothetical protein